MQVIIIEKTERENCIFQRNIVERTSLTASYNFTPDKDRRSSLDPSPLRKDSVLWIYGDSVSEQFFWGVRSRPLCTNVFKWCGHTYNWIYQLKGDDVKFQYISNFNKISE